MQAAGRHEIRGVEGWQCGPVLKYMHVFPSEVHGILAYVCYIGIEHTVALNLAQDIPSKIKSQRQSLRGQQKYFIQETVGTKVV